MRHGRIRGVPLPVPRLIQGTLLLGREDLDAADPLLDAAFEAGLTAFDTAVVYGRGTAERRLGAWIAARGVRDAVVVIDKGCHSTADRARMTPDDLEHDLTGSLERLGIDCIDLYLLHRDDPSVPVGEIVSALNEQQSRGRVRAFGASNWTHQRLQAAGDYALERGLVPFAASSPGLSLAESITSWPGCVGLQPARDREACLWYRRSELPLLAWSPLAGGFLTGRYSRENLEQLDAPADRRVIEFYGSEANFARLDRLALLAAAKQVTPAAAALAYVLAQPLDVYAVVGARDHAEIAACSEALSVTLAPHELAWLDEGAT